MDNYNIWTDKDLLDHGARPEVDHLNGYARDLVDVDLSDHGALPEVDHLNGYARDLVDVDLSDHGQTFYVPRSETWGTDDPEIVKQMNILMRAVYFNNIESVVAVLSPESLAKLIDFRFRQSANKIDECSHGLSKDDQEALGTSLYMDFLLIDKSMSLNPNALKEIFSPNVYLGSKELTDIFGVITKYQQLLGQVKTQIPMINGGNMQVVLDPSGKVVTAFDTVNYLMSKKEVLSQDSGTRGM